MQIRLLVKNSFARVARLGRGTIGKGRGIIGPRLWPTRPTNLTTAKGSYSAPRTSLCNANVKGHKVSIGLKNTPVLGLGVINPNPCQ
jgi:hypothetical protein